jgi:hypothetical protein
MKPAISVAGLTCRYGGQLAAALITTRAHGWPGIGRIFTTPSAAELTGLPAALAVALLASGYATVRRVTV